MKLSRKLVARLAELYPGSAHVSAVDLLQSPDREIWEFAKAGDFVIVSTDSDLYDLATTVGPPPQSSVAAAMGAPDEGRRAGAAARSRPDYGIRSRS